MKKNSSSFSFEYDKKMYSAIAECIGQNVWIHFHGRTYCTSLHEAPGGSKRNRKGVVENSNKILAPMPGKISKILVVQEQGVEIGQVLIVMEAMKMEYTLKSSLKSRVKSVAVKTGDQVQLGQQLIELEDMK